MGFASTTGLDYAACIAALAAYLPRWQARGGADDPIHGLTVPDLMDDLRTIERAMLDGWAEQAEKERQKNKSPVTE